MTLSEITQAIKKGQTLLPYPKLTEEDYRAWYENYHKYELEHFTVALTKVINEPGREWFPKPGEVNVELFPLANRASSRRSFDCNMNDEEHQEMIEYHLKKGFKRVYTAMGPGRWAYHYEKIK